MSQEGKAASPLGSKGLCGIYFGIVVANEDDEQQLARIKVRLPWLPNSDNDTSTWAQLCVPMAGDEFGTYTLPENEDTVAIAFIGGDINHPIVLGGIWSAQDPPPEVNENGKNDFQLIKSRSGHRILLDDSSESKIVFTDKTDKNYIGIGSFAEGGDSSNKKELSTPNPIHGSPSQGVAMVSMEGDINLWCPSGVLSVESKEIEFTASGQADLKAGGSLTVESDLNAKVCSAKAGKYQGNPIKIGP